MNSFRKNIYSSAFENIITRTILFQGIGGGTGFTGDSGTGIYDVTHSGTITIANGSYIFRANAYTYSSPAGSVNVSVTIDGVNIASARSTIGNTLSSSYITRSDGVWNYSIRVNSNSSTGSSGGNIDVV